MSWFSSFQAKRTHSAFPIDADNPRSIVIIGAGLAGLAAALRARSLGYRVIIIEKEHQVGGKVTSQILSLPVNKSTEHPIFTHTDQDFVTNDREISFDPGATIVTMPEIIYAPLRALGIDQESLDRALPLELLSPAYHFATPDVLFNVYSDRMEMCQEISRIFGPQAMREYIKLRDWLEKLFHQVYPHFIQEGFSYHRFYLGTKQWTKALGQILLQCRHYTWQKKLQQFIKNPILARAFSFQALFAGLIPKTAYSIYMVIAYMDSMLGVYYPRNGMSAIADIYAQYLADSGGEIFLQEEVTSLHYSDNIWQIRSLSAEFRADAVIFAGGDKDFSRLIDPTQKHHCVLAKPQYSPSAVVAHFLVRDDRLHVQLPYHHTISTGKVWETIFEDITLAQRPGLMSDPAFLITRITAQIPISTNSQASDRGDTGNNLEAEIVSVLAPCANLNVQDLDWENFYPEYIAQIQEILISRGFDFFHNAKLIRCDHPHTWLAQGNAAGTPFSRAHILRQSGPLRAAMNVAHYPGLYRAGADTVPGIGIPSVITSGILAAEAAHRYLL